MKITTRSVINVPGYAFTKEPGKPWQWFKNGSEEEGHVTYCSALEALLDDVLKESQK